MVPVSFDPPLARWVFTQRNDLKANRISTERKERLDQIGFVWYPEDYLWVEKYEKMKQHLRATKQTKPLVNEDELYRWYKQQKKDVRAGRMSEERARRLKVLMLDVF